MNPFPTRLLPGSFDRGSHLRKSRRVGHPAYLGALLLLGMGVSCKNQFHIIPSCFCGDGFL